MKKSEYSLSLPKLELPRKPTYIKLKEDIPFFHFFCQIEKEEPFCFLLESLELGTSHNRYNVIGFSPEIHIEAFRDSLTWWSMGQAKQKIFTKNPYETIAKWAPKNIISRNYAGGLVGYIGYDASHFFEPILKIKEHEEFPTLCFGLYIDGIIHDKLTGETFYFYYTTNRIEKIEKWIKKTSSASLSLTSFAVKKEGHSCTKSEHQKMVLTVKEEIRAGNTFQCQIGFQENYKINGSPLSFYNELRQINPSPHMYYLKLDQRVLVGSSPELVFRLQQKEIESFPLAGTVRRGKNMEEDVQLARQLLNDEKEIAEHNMLVDLHRNDVGRISRFTSVRVRHLMEVKKFSHVQHISSEVVSLIQKGHDMFSGLAAVFPAGTLSGAPKIESMKIIERLEQQPRGPYGGAVGHFGLNGDCTFAIPIRTLFIHKENAFIRASGGIVYDSTPEAEYDEIIRKMKALSLCLEKFT